MSVNTFTVSGRVVRDPELRFLPSGDSVFENAIAVEHYKKEGENETSFFDWKAYGGFADLLAAKLKKGDSVVISGYAKQESWETSEGKRSKVVIIVQAVEGEFKYRPSSGQAPEAEAAPAAASSQGDDIPF